MYSIYRNYAFFPFQVAFGIDLNAVNDPDSLFPAAIKECLVAPVWCLSHPLHAIDFTTYGYQNTVVAAVHFLRDTGKKIMDERRKAILNGDDVPSDILTYILKSAPEDTQLDYEEVLDHFITFFIAGRLYRKVLLNVIIQFAIKIILQISNDRPPRCFLPTFTIKQELFLARSLML